MRSFLRFLLRRRPSRHSAQSQAQKPKSNQRPNPNSQQQQQVTLTGSMTTAAVAYACSMSVPSAKGAVPDDHAEKTHHNKEGKGFINPWDSWREWSAPGIFKAMLWKKLTGQFQLPDTTPPTVPVRPPTFLPRHSPSTTLRATWLGHACYYVEFPSGLRVLFDPVFEPRCSPFSFMGPKRYTPPPCGIADIPIVDLIIISHSHYDHLSHPTVMELHQKHPNAHFLVGLGLKKWFLECGIQNVEELDWWDDVDVRFTPTAGEGEKALKISPAPSSSSKKSLEKENPAQEGEITARISCLPCQHTSARTTFDKGHTLWCSWAVTSNSKSVWFGGDTGYRAVPDLGKEVDDYADEFRDLPFCPAFKQIGELRGPFDLGLIPIGAYDPRFIMSPMHANPFDSVNIFLDTRCKRAMGIHWGTWVLTAEDVLEPPVLLKKALKWKGVSETGVFDVCDIGESREF